MNLFNTIMCLLALPLLGMSFVFKLYPPNTENGTCLYKGTFHEVNTTWQGDDCVQLYCIKGDDNKSVAILTASCSNISKKFPKLFEDCDVKYDYKQPFPKCCRPADINCNKD